jgi:competence protein ComEC
LVFFAGVALTHSGVPTPLTPLLLSFLLWPIAASRRPAERGVWILVAAASLVSGATASHASSEVASASAFTTEPDSVAAGGLARWRGRLVVRLDTLYGDEGPLVSALVLSDKSHLDPALRDAFARSGTAHLLAISGFHVGVVAGLLLVLLRSSGMERRRAGLLAAAAAWLYVALIGFPDAACRAALILTLVSLSGMRGRSSARWGALAAALLLLLALDPARVAGAGFQLSFAGAAGLVAWAPGIRDGLVRRRLPSGLARAVAAGAAATLATLPVVAWHFERVSLVGIPATLFAAPLVTVALPGALLSLAADFVSHAAGHFLAGGVDLVLIALAAGVRAIASLPWASLWIPRTWVWITGIGALAGTVLLRGENVRPRVRRTVAVLSALAALALWPVLLGLQARGTMEMFVLDVGQGDALVMRTPYGRWVMVDTGPADPEERDPGKNTVVRDLRRLGIRRIELLILTHPDFDHIGGTIPVLRSFSVGAVMDPAYAAGKSSYVAILDTARARGIPWRKAHHGEVIEMDGVTLDVMAPWPEGVGPLEPGESPTNAVSVVLHVQYGAFDALLMGDAPSQVERALARSLHGGIEVLKIGHHGSATATDPIWVARAHPAVALISVGRHNRYGHPSPRVLARLRRAGVPVRRTDREGTLDVLARSDGSFEVTAEGASSSVRHPFRGTR